MNENVIWFDRSELNAVEGVTTSNQAVPWWRTSGWDTKRCSDVALKYCRPGFVLHTSVAGRGANGKHTRYSRSIRVSIPLSLSLSVPIAWLYGASVSRNNRLVGGCVSNRIPGQLLRPPTWACGNVVIDSMLRATKSSKEGTATWTDMQMHWRICWQDYRNSWFMGALKATPTFRYI